MKIGYLISFVAGGAIGTAVTFFVSQKHFEKRKQIELDAYKEYYDSKLEKTEINKEIRPETDGDSDLKIEDSQYESRTLETIEPDDTSVEADVIREAANALVAEQIAEEEKVSKKRGKKKEKLKPYLITAEAYNGEDEILYKHDYQHITLDYYEGDDIVCASASNEVFANTGRWLGYIWKNHFGDQDYEYGPDEVFIRNDEIKVDYEIIRDEGYYSQEVLGIKPDFEDYDDNEAE